MKYNVDDAEVQEIASTVIEDWTRQYKELSNFVHGTNSNFFQKTEYLDEFKFIKKGCEFFNKTSRSVIEYCKYIAYNFLF